MSQLTDIEIARAHKESGKLKSIYDIAHSAGIGDEYIEPYGKHKAKISLSYLEGKRNSPRGKLVLVTAITPTAAGEGKTTTSIGLADALNILGKKSALALREPSLGPVFGVKGGATGGGYSQVVPMEDINLHFTGDFHAIGSANNLLCALLDNHIYQGNALRIDPEKITLRRCVDMNDRQLRCVRDGLGRGVDGVPRNDGFDITVASEVMAVFCLATSVSDLKRRLASMIVAYDVDGKPVTAGDLHAEGAMTALLRDALSPNLVQTLGGVPAFVHGGPFANIAHGCNSVIATETALVSSEYTVTEAGFGADLGAEKFIDIKCRMSGLAPDAVVIVATVRALKMHGGMPLDELKNEDLSALEAGMPNLLRHISNIKNTFGLPCTVAINKFPTDTEDEIRLVIEKCAEAGVVALESDVWARGGEGAVELAREVILLCEGEHAPLSYAYELDSSIEEKIDAIVKRVYGGDGAELTDEAREQIKVLTELGYSGLPVCMAKTQSSFSDDKARLGAPEGFKITVRSVRISAGAGFIVALTGNILTMPGLPKIPAANGIDVDDDGNITGLF